MNTQTLSYARPSLNTVSRPWMPQQLLAASLVFGPLAAGIVAGVNFARMGHKASARPIVLISALYFVAELLLVAVILPEGLTQPAAMALNVAFGGLLMLIQKPSFDQWKAAHFRPTKPKEQYRPNELGKLFLVALAGLAIELVLVFGLLLAVGQI